MTKIVRDPILPAPPREEEFKDYGFMALFYRGLLLVLQELHANIYDDISQGAGLIAHAPNHENGGSDEINVGGLSGELADAQPPKTHKASHEDGGVDEISVAGLLGVLGTKQDADKLQARNVDAAAPSGGDVLTWDQPNTKWKPVAPVVAGGPVGSITIWPTATPPSGYLECNGAPVSRTTYASLFAVIGTMYGVGDGSTTFNLPDLRGEFVRGWDHGRGVDPDKATRTDRGDGTTGDNVGTKQMDQFKSHVHALGAWINSPSGGNLGNIAWYVTNQDTGAAGGNETRARNVYMMYIIKY